MPNPILIVCWLAMAIMSTGGCYMIGMDMITRPPPDWGGVVFGWCIFTALTLLTFVLWAAAAYGLTSLYRS